MKWLIKIPSNDFVSLVVVKGFICSCMGFQTNEISIERESSSHAVVKMALSTKQD